MRDAAGVLSWQAMRRVDCSEVCFGGCESGSWLLHLFPLLGIGVVVCMVCSPAHLCTPGRIAGPRALVSGCERAGAAGHPRNVPTQHLFVSVRMYVCASEKVEIMRTWVVHPQAALEVGLPRCLDLYLAPLHSMHHVHRPLFALTSLCLP